MMMMVAVNHGSGADRTGKSLLYFPRDFFSLDGKRYLHSDR